MMKKIYVAYTGGTIGMKSTRSGYVPSDNLIALLNDKLADADKKKHLPQFELYEYKNLIDSSNINPSDWQIMATDIDRHYKDYDGFVILHGTDTMAYSCAMISFMLKNIKKPVIFTGSQIPLCEPDTDALENFIGSLLAANDERISEVCLYFNGKLMRGNRTRKSDANSVDAFDSPNYPALSGASSDLTLEKTLLWNPKDAENFRLNCNAEAYVLPLCLFPGISSDWLQTALNQPYPAVILQTYGVGNGPEQNTALMKVLSEANERGKVIVNQTPCYKGSVQQSRYSSGSAMAHAGLVSGLDMTPEALYCKLHYLFSIGSTPEQVKSLMNVSLCGELTLH